MKAIEIVGKKRLCFNNLFRNYKSNLKYKFCYNYKSDFKTGSYESLDYKNNAYLD